VVWYERRYLPAASGAALDECGFGLSDGLGLGGLIAVMRKWRGLGRNFGLLLINGGSENGEMWVEQ
jgi:hypothetical protein